VRLGQKVENIEVTVALREGRKMADEYKRDAPSLRYDRVENWVDRANGIRSALEKAITKKGEKRYGSGVWLVVYLNIGSVYLNMRSWDIRQAEKIECAIAEIKQRHGPLFGGLFVIWNGKLL
jgi:hypothetical protein